MDATRQALIWAQKERAKGELQALRMLLYQPEIPGSDQYKAVTALIRKFCEELDNEIG